MSRAVDQEVRDRLGELVEACQGYRPAELYADENADNLEAACRRAEEVLEQTTSEPTARQRYGLRIAVDPHRAISEPLHLALLDPQGCPVHGQIKAELIADHNQRDQVLRVTFHLGFLDVEVGDARPVVAELAVQE